MRSARTVSILLSLLLSTGAIAASKPDQSEPSLTSQSLFGNLSEPYAEASEKTARQFLSANAGRFHLDPTLGDLFLSASFSSPLGRHFVFRQEYQGVPVYGAEVKVHFNRAGRVVAVNWAYAQELKLASVFPAVTPEQAQDAVHRAVPPNDPADSDDPPGPPSRSSQLYVVVAGSEASLAWEVVQETGGPTWKAFVNAQTGKLLGAPSDINRYVNGTGQVFRVNAVVATGDNTLRDNRDSASAVPSSAYMTVTLQGLAGNGFLDGSFASSSKTRKRASNASNNFIFDRSSDGFSETMGYYYLDYAQRYIQSLGFSNVNNRQQVFSVNRFKRDNSFYSPSTKEITYGTGGVDDAEDADVIVHEYGHSIQDNQVPGFGSTLEAGSMGEGFGDYLAGSIGAQFSGGFQDVCLAEWDATSYSSTTPPCLRRLDGTKHYPEDIVGEVHDDGEIWSAAMWQIHNAIGASRADLVILQHHFLLSPSASFNQAANALVTAAINLGYTSTEVSSIRNILLARGFTVTV